MQHNLLTKTVIEDAEGEAYTYESPQRAGGDAKRSPPSPKHWRRSCPDHAMNRQGPTAADVASARIVRNTPAHSDHALIEVTYNMKTKQGEQASMKGHPGWRNPPEHHPEWKAYSIKSTEHMTTWKNKFDKWIIGRKEVNRSQISEKYEKMCEGMKQAMRTTVGETKKGAKREATNDSNMLYKITSKMADMGLMKPNTIEEWKNLVERQSQEKEDNTSGNEKKVNESFSDIFEALSSRFYSDFTH